MLQYHLIHYNKIDHLLVVMIIMLTLHWSMHFINKHVNNFSQSRMWEQGYCIPDGNEVNAAMLSQTDAPTLPLQTLMSDWALEIT